MRPAIILIIITVIGLPVWVAAQPTGLDKMTDLWSLPSVDLGSLSFGTSSRDPSGHNEDGFSGIFSRIYYENGEHVLFDAQGPGCVYRMWFTFSLPILNFRLRFYLDGEETPSVDTKFTDFFAESEAPFLQPLVWDDQASSGGFVSYVPICYEDRLKVTATGWITFFNFTAQQYWGDVPVDSFTGAENYTQAQTIYDPATTGSDPKDTTGVAMQTETYQIDPDEQLDIATDDQAGQVASIRLTPTILDEDLLNEVSLRIWFDGADEPQVDVPLGMFFGATAPGFQVAALLFGIKDGTLYCFLPMPYFSEMRMTLANQSEQEIEIETEIAIKPGMPDDRAGIFEAQYRVSAPPILEQDHLFFAAEGQGRFVGAVQIVDGQSGQRYLEGDERYYPDGLQTPTIQGTGTEDYYNGGWYFREGTFTLPTHGHQMRQVTPDVDTTGMYRLHVGDALDFFDGALFSIEHDANNLFNDEIERSCAFLYRIDEPALVLEDEIDIGDPAEDARVDYVGGNDEPLGEMMQYYEGDRDDEAVTDDGYRSHSSVSLTVQVNPYNDGVRLVRRIDQNLGRETVRVSVDGVDAGIWRTSDRNPFKRWRDAVFDLPPSLTKGRNSLQLTLQNESPGNGFTQFRYWVYSWKRPILMRMTALSLDMGVAELEVGATLILSVLGAYPSGNEVETAGWVDYRLSDENLASIENGVLTALAEGEVNVTAFIGELESNEVTLQIVPVTDDDTLDDDSSDDDAIDDDVADDDQTDDDDATDDDTIDDDAADDGQTDDDDDNDDGCGCRL